MPPDDTGQPDPASLPLGGWPGIDYELEVEAHEDDEAYVVWMRTSVGQQPYVWRMRLHVHDHDCGRA